MFFIVSLFMQCGFCTYNITQFGPNNFQAFTRFKIHQNGNSGYSGQEREAECFIFPLYSLALLN